MSTETDAGGRSIGGFPPLQFGLILAAIAVVVLYAVGVFFAPRALDLAGHATGLLAIAITVLWIGDAI